MRINARVSEEQARQLDELRQATGQSASDVVREALRRYHQQVFKSRTPRAAVELAGFIGCGEADPDLSERYKEALSESVADKHDRMPGRTHGHR